MFCRKKKEEKEKLALIKKLNDKIDSVKDEIASFATAIAEELADSGFIWSLKTKAEWLYASPKYLNDYSCENINERIRKVDEIQGQFKEQITEHWKKVVKNKEDLLNWYKNGVPLFITLSPLWGGFWGGRKKIYAMCYEFKKNTEHEGLYSAYIFAQDTESGMIFDIDPCDTSISKMTEEEFEDYYIMGRMNVTNFGNENEAIEYDNSIRRLFHGQRETE